jgi:two-component system, NarL family, sensor kinase
MMMDSRLPVESGRPVVAFGFLRLVLTIVSLAAVLVFSVPHSGALSILIAGVALPWALALFLVARNSAEAALAPWVAVGDIAVLAAAELIEPKTYAAVRFIALFLIAAHAQFQGEQRGLAIALLASVVLVPIGVLQPHPIAGHLIGFYESVFVVSALAGALFIGRMRTGESAGRLRARELSRRAIEAENEVRRRLAESIHDGPVQELVSLDMMLSAVRGALVRGEKDRALASVGEAQEIAERNIRSLRDEIVALGPYAFEELTFQSAVQQCVPIWEKRFGFDVLLDLDDIDLSSEVCGALFGIAQEAVSNSARHAAAETVSVSLKNADGVVIMRVVDDGKGFEGVAPLGSHEIGHIGLASMRERAELIGGRLEIDSTEHGTEVRTTVPLAGDGRPRRRRRLRGARGAKAISD